MWEILTCHNRAFDHFKSPQEDLAELDAALHDYNDMLDSVLVPVNDLDDLDDLEPADLDDWLAEGNFTWRANYLDATPNRRRTLESISGNAKLMVIAWLTQAAVFTILIAGMVL